MSCPCHDGVSAGPSITRYLALRYKVYVAPSSQGQAAAGLLYHKAINSCILIPIPCCRWGLVFPLGVFSLAAEQLGSSQNLDSEAFRVAGAGLAGVTVVVWASVAGRTFYHLLTGTLTEPPSLL